MDFLSLKTAFSTKEEFFKELSYHLIHNLGARQCRLVDVPYSPPEIYPSRLFKLGEDSKKEHWLYVQFTMGLMPSTQELDYLALFMQSHFSRLHLKEIENELNELIHRDDVTNLFNQRRLYKDIDEAIETYQKNKIPFSFLFIDIDHFKSVNDNNGHLVGSKLLIQMGDVIKKQVREIDLVYRYGGDEFVVLLPRCSGSEAESIGHRILEAVIHTPFKADDRTTKTLSVSIGVSDYPQSSRSREDIIRYADDMMYTAKKNGRGRVVYKREVVASSV